ncbi:MAG TPA: DUF3299 domain-containing protein, partial [Gemmataceae bacterium]|nr:DUF3299 domain-containing protein [Gemmataceae bacterium]
KRLPSGAVAQAQQLALWLPADARLLWQLAELAAAHSDVATAAAMMDGCVTEFGLRDPTLRDHRRAMRAAADERAKNGPTKEHDASAATWKPRSSRPLVRRIDAGELPPVRARGVNALPWTVVTETTVDRQYHPTFPRYLKQLDGKEVSLTGFMQPLGEELEVNAFMLIEYPVGCWYCEMPEMTAIVLVELPANKTYNYTRGQVRITGRLKLNDSDPENFLFILRQAKVTEAE